LALRPSQQDNPAAALLAGLRASEALLRRRRGEVRVGRGGSGG